MSTATEETTYLGMTFTLYFCKECDKQINCREVYLSTVNHDHLHCRNGHRVLVVEVFNRLTCVSKKWSLLP